MARKPKSIKSLLKSIKKSSKSSKSFLNKKTFLKNAAKKLEKNKTWPELEFEKMMTELQVKFESQKIVGQKIFDYYIPSKNMLVEVDGCYFHGNPAKYTELNKMQKRNIKNDKFKDILAKGMGFKIERIWESDLKEKYEESKERFKVLLLS